jgi:hypothetical protein
MRVLLDNGTPRGISKALAGHLVEEARAHGWDTLRNGDLLDAAESARFEVFVTTDQNIRMSSSSRSGTSATISAGVIPFATRLTM